MATFWKDVLSIEPLNNSSQKDQLCRCCAKTCPRVDDSIVRTLQRQYLLLLHSMKVVSCSYGIWRTCCKCLEEAPQLQGRHKKIVIVMKWMWIWILKLPRKVDIFPLVGTEVSPLDFVYNNK